MAESLESYYTIVAKVGLEIPKIKGSKFIGLAFPVGSRSEARLAIEQARSEYSDASHHCFAYRLHADPVLRYASDDGEPTATAGIPILRQLESRDLQNVLIVVIRYFGGTKLGKGGLIRAYGSAARELISGLDLVQRTIQVKLKILFPYSDTGIVKRVLTKSKAEILDEEYGEKTSFILALSKGKEQTFIREMDDALAGKLDWKKISEDFD